MSLRSSLELVRRAGSLPLREWGDFAVAMAELAKARMSLLRAGNDLAMLLTSATGTSGGAGSDPCQLARVGRALGRAAAIVPWRADCLVKALAARHWLARIGIPSTIEFGARCSPEFEAHAWVKVGDRVVTGGDVGQYAPLTGRR